MNYILAIDIGTTNCKAVTFDKDGNIVSSIKSGYTTFTGEDGKSEQDPEELFRAVWQLIEQSVQQHPQICAVSFSAAMHSVIAVGDDGTPLTNAIIWADTRAVKGAEKLKGSEAGKTIYEKTGTPIHPMSPLCKIIWIRETWPDVYAKAKKYISIKEFIFWKLFGKYIVDYSIASATGLFDIRNLHWCPEALHEAGIAEAQLSEPVEVTHIEQKLQPLYLSGLPQNGALQFVVGGNDGCLANLGSGVIAFGDASLTIGTSGAIRMTTHTSQTDKEQRVFTYLLTKDFYITGGAINNGGITLEWLSRMLLNDETPKDPDELLHLAETVPAGANNLLFLPYLLGERAPMWDAAAKGVLFGLTQQHTKAHIARAAVEGVCFAMRNVLEAIEDVNGIINSIFASGGFTQSQFWLQTMADVLGKEISINNSADASATGAAIIGMYALSFIENLTDAARFFKRGQTYVPDEIAQKKYASLFPVFASLYPKLKDEFATLSNL